MFDVKQFRTSLYLVVIVGLTGFAVASESGGLWLLAVALVLANAWVSARGQFRPLPRSVYTVVAVAGFMYAGNQVWTRAGSPILAVGQYLVLLQVVKVWEQKANRDYAQLLILSLLLMVAAAISTGSLVFGLLFLGYLLLSLYCCLLFHLKVETDDARAARAMPADVGSPSAAGDAAGRRSLGRSIRRLTGLVAVYGLVAAVATFLFFPRIGGNMFGQFALRPQRPLTGFSEQVGFQQVARITQNNDQVATVRLYKDNVPYRATQSLLLRGVTHDYYSGDAAGDKKASYQWGRDPRAGRLGPVWDMVPDGGILRPSDRRNVLRPAAGPVYRQEVDLNPIGSTALFALPGANAVRIDDPAPVARQVIIHYFPLDQTLRMTSTQPVGIRYTVESSGSLGNLPTPPHEPSRIDPLVGQLARQAGVTGGLAALRDREMAARRPFDRGRPSALDDQIADRIEAYLRTNYKYTLDLTKVAQIEGRDPMVAFLYDFKKGHCEYFAGAMTLMCQSLGMEARMAVGFKVDEYNDFGHYYAVRQSEAHTWVEVRTADGWRSYDPTSGSEEANATASAWLKTKQFIDYLEYAWQNSVILYNADSRDSLISSVDARMTNTAINSTSTLAHLTAMVQKVGDWLASEIVGPLVAVLTVGLVGAVGWFGWERWRVRRRARRIGLAALAPDEQAKLVRQLGFYDDLLQLLDRHAIRRPPHLTPREFSRSLTFLPAGPFETVRRLTEVYYRIRFGHAELDDGQARRLSTVVVRLEAEMGGTGGSA